MTRIVTIDVNGVEHRLRAAPDRSLLEVLRDELGLTGTKYGCGEGQCGACTVLIDGRPARSCSTLLSSCRGAPITTIEGVADGDRMHPVQEAFVTGGAMQCGYCTPGMIMSSVALLSANPDPSERDIVAAMQGNICRCGTYPRIVQAIRAAAPTMRDSKKKTGNAKKGGGR